MATLSDDDRKLTMAEIMRDLSDNRISCSITKPDLQAAINAVDDWVVANTISFNNALPTAAKNGLTTAQKAMALMYVVGKRYKVGA